MKWLIPYAGKVWTYDDSKLTAAEARVQKRITNGQLPAQADQARMQLDPEAWVAALVIARRRAGLTADVALDVDADDVDLMDAVELTMKDLQAQAAAAEAEQSLGDESKAEPETATS